MTGDARSLLTEIAERSRQYIQQYVVLKVGMTLSLIACLTFGGLFVNNLILIPAKQHHSTSTNAKPNPLTLQPQIY